MRLTIRHQLNPEITIEVEDSAEQCALFIAELQRKSDLFETGKPAKSRRRNSSRPSQKNIVGRPYGGRTNRRELIIQTMKSLAEQGNTTPRLQEIKQRFLELFPNHSTDHLDQVVRDLVNKTDWVVRSERGAFMLAS